jgi:hypothetical protein
LRFLKSVQNTASAELCDGFFRTESASANTKKDFHTRALKRIMLLKVHKNENFFGFDFEFCTFSMLVMHK